LAATFLLLGQFALAGSLLAILRHLVQGCPLPGLEHIAAAHGLGALLLVALILVDYNVQNAGPPVTAVLLPFAAMLLVLLTGLQSLLSSPSSYLKYREVTPEFSVTYTLLLVQLALIIVPALLWRI
jgi:hypothetical protein